MVHLVLVGAFGTSTGYIKITQQDVQQALETFDNDGH